MKNLLIILSAFLFFACGGSKQVVQNTPDTPSKNSIQEPKKDTPKIEIPIEEKAPEIEIKEDIVSQKKDSIIEKPKTVIEKPKAVSKTINHQLWNTLLAKYVSQDGSVNYAGFKKDRALFTSYLKILEQNMPDQTASKNDKLAYWMNVYNAFTVKLIIDNYPIKSIKDIKDPWDLRFFKLGTKWYTLNDVEHRILRKMEDPRIHFGINCASISCPPLLNKAFTANTVDQELEKLTIAFINDSKRNTITSEKIEISKIFSWFAKDFKKEGSLIDFLNSYSNIKINKNAKKNFKTYDWNLNQ
ncbi:DUF547 domain-containing protein [Aquimarina mytili]|uniref:DUF547 domain-containing protein n=1 Tax=Aquimarina mytili TaxID=874423 RepID=A0A937D7Y8_9FLAO|nr:DUF547 domain-containing protein [Aquimarina mytili]MBL0682197.1 DUF547 domain-containing protein [Aquimarina mytili]